jgi:hypothetical protein
MRKHIGNRSLASWKIFLSTVLALVVLARGAGAEGLTPEQQLAHDIYKELVEIDTTTATGDTTRAAEAMAARRAGVLASAAQG